MKYRERKKIRDFVDFTMSDEATAKEYLENCSWNLERAVNKFFSENSDAMQGRGKRGKKRKKGNEIDLLRLFSSIKDEGEDEVISDNIEKFCVECGIGIDSFEFLFLSYTLRCEVLFEISKQEFIEGFEFLKVDSLQVVRKQVDERLLTFSSDISEKKALYQWIFKAFLEEGSRSLLKEEAQKLWEMLFGFDMLIGAKDPNKELAEKWIQFIRQSDMRAISFDTWKLVYDFILGFDGNIERYNSDDSWPVAVDEFVEYMKKGC